MRARGRRAAASSCSGGAPSTCAATAIAAEDELFYAEQNARLVANAEEYYRAMFGGRVASWNLRDRHMADTLERARRPPRRAAAGRARSSSGRTTRTSATPAPPRWAARGELNVGQLARERYGRDAVLVGFTTYTGTVTAASDWGAAAERKRVRPALPGSYEALFHEAGRAALSAARLRDGDAAPTALREPAARAGDRRHLPARDRAREPLLPRAPADQFDAVIHFDETRAVEPLERTAVWERGEPPETYPTAL